MTRVIVPHSGSAGSARRIARLAERPVTEVVAVTLDVGQGIGLDDAQERALAAGAARAHVLDVREEFANAFVLPALRAGVLAPPPVRALGCAIVARHLVEIAAIEDASTVAYRGDRGAAMDTLLKSLQPSLKRLPLADVPRASSATSTVSNLAGRWVNAGAEHNPHSRLIAGDPPDRPASLEIMFQCGVPVAVNAVEMPLVELLQSLDTIAGTHGVGRIEAWEDEADSRGRLTYEAPAALVLQAARTELHDRLLSTDARSRMAGLTRRYAELVSAGLWHTPARRELDALIEVAQLGISGVVRLRLHAGTYHVEGASSALGAAAGRDASPRDGRR
jgi:argininosuccinate synthase